MNLEKVKKELPLRHLEIQGSAEVFLCLSTFAGSHVVMTESYVSEVINKSSESTECLMY